MVILEEDFVHATYHLYVNAFWFNSGICWLDRLHWLYVESVQPSLNYNFIGRQHYLENNPFSASKNCMVVVNHLDYTFCIRSQNNAWEILWQRILLVKRNASINQRTKFIKSHERGYFSMFECLSSVDSYSLHTYYVIPMIQPKQLWCHFHLIIGFFRRFVQDLWL